jgi:hypothetical protein
MVAAATTIGGAVRIARAKPSMTGRIVREILKVETAKYELHGNPSPECRNVACGHAIDAIDALYEGIERKQTVIRFVERQRRNSRPAIRRKAEAFLKTHAAAE